MRDSLRTFVAIEIPHEVRDRARQLIERLSPTDANVKWVSADQMHWTLKFLGEVELLEVPRICSAVASAVAPLAPFDIEACGAGAFPNPYAPRTVWLGTGEGGEQLVDLHARVDSQLGQLGFRAEKRRFRPHLTLGRVRRSNVGLRELGDLITANADFDAGTSTVFEVVVYSSELGPKGPVYEPLGRVELAGG